MSNVAMDFCRVQRLINQLGGSSEFPSYADISPEFVDDRLTQYGFGYWSDMAAHIADGGHWKWLKHPPLPGVYAITVVACDYVGHRVPKGAEHLLYIGCAKNIAKRLASPDHWYNKIVRRFHNADCAVVVRVLLTNEYLWAERSLIKTLRPALNIQHNG